MADIEAIGYFDGACEPLNPKGISTYGYVIFQGNDVITEGKGVCGEPFTYSSTNNTDEYFGVLSLLKSALDRGIKRILVRGDSQLVIMQMKGNYSVNAPHLIPLYNECLNLVDKFDKVKLEWVRREENSYADRLSHEAYVEYIDEHNEVFEKIQSYLATEKQKNFMKALGIEFDKYIGKREASRLIDRRTGNR